MLFPVAKTGRVTDGAKRPPTWIEVALTNAGVVRGATSISWAWCWGITREVLGHDPTVEEVAEWWGSSERTAYRDHASFKKAFPFLDSPATYVDQPEVKPLVEAAARGMKRFAENMQRRKNEKRDRRPIDTAALKIGFLPCTIAPGQ
jgi:hypothetical protein